MRLARKKAAQLQLQTELGSDEEWDKFLQRDGLVVVDVYSEWCGPCLGMVGNLKKLKVEVGGDNLHLAVAKSDSIDCLKRFRSKSEPTWMFIAGGKLTQVLTGADAPRLTRVILQELRHLEEVRRGERERPNLEPCQLTPDEQEAVTAAARAAEERRARERAAAEASRLARRVARADLLEPYIKDVCPLLLWPHAHRHLKKIAELLEPYGIIVADKCPMLVSKETQAALWEGLPAEERESLLASSSVLTERPSLAVLLKRPPNPDSAQPDLVETVHRVLCVERRPEGEEGRTSEEEARGEGGRGVFVPADRLQRAAAVDVLYSKLVSSVVEPPTPETPPHVAVVFGAWQRHLVFAVCAKYPADVLQVGFFADTNITAPKNLAKTLAQYEQRPEKDYDDTLAVMVAHREAGATEDDPAILRELVALGPLHVSEDTVVGEDECRRLFPPGYGVPDPKPHAKTKKKKSKKRSEAGKEGTPEQSATASEPGGVGSGTAAEPRAEGAAGAGEAGEGGEGEAAPHESEEEDEPPEENLAEDKATSPIPDGVATN